jgi:hypothetical protein
MAYEELFTDLLRAEREEKTNPRYTFVVKGTRQRFTAAITAQLQTGFKPRLLFPPACPRLSWFLGGK